MTMPPGGHPWHPEMQAAFGTGPRLPRHDSSNGAAPVQGAWLSPARIAQDKAAREEHERAVQRNADDQFGSPEQIRSRLNEIEARQRPAQLKHHRLNPLPWLIGLLFPAFLVASFITEVLLGQEPNGLTALLTFAVAGSVTGVLFARSNAEYQQERSDWREHEQLLTALGCGSSTCYDARCRRYG